MCDSKDGTAEAIQRRVSLQEVKIFVVAIVCDGDLAVDVFSHFEVSPHGEGHSERFRETLHTAR